MQIEADYRKWVDNNYFKVHAPLDGNHFTLAFGKDRSKKFRKMFSKFKIEKPQHVLYRRGPRCFEAEQSVISLPLLDATDARIRSLQAENDQLRARDKEKDARIFQLTQELQLLQEEVAQSRLAVNPVKNTVKFNVSRRSYWDVEKSARSSKRKKLKELFQNVAETLPPEFKPVEVCSNSKSVK